MKRGFMDFATTRLIPDHPGHTASWYAYEYLQLGDDSDFSDSKTPEKSLANTLSKQVQTGREKRVRRERIKGVYCFFPTSVSESNEDVVLQLSLSAQELKDIDNLVTVGKFENRSKAVKWLATEGIKTNRSYLDKVADTRNQIERLKKDL